MNACTTNFKDPASTNGVRTLVVDDSPFMLRILAQILQEAGDFDLIGTATDGCQALRHLQVLSPELVLMDFHMPHFNGIEATRCIKARECPPVVIIITSDDSSAARLMAEEAGADAFIVKTGSLYLRLTRTLQNLFGPRGARRTAVDGDSHQTAPATQLNQEHSHEKSCAKHLAEEPANPALALRWIRSTRSARATLSDGTLFSGSAQCPHAQCSRPFEHPGGFSHPSRLSPPTGRAPVRSPTDSAREKGGR